MKSSTNPSNCPIRISAYQRAMEQFGIHSTTTGRVSNPFVRKADSLSKDSRPKRIPPQRLQDLPDITLGGSPSDSTGTLV